MKTIIFILALFSFSAFSQTWKKVESGTNLRLNSISFGSSQVGYVGADDGVLLKTMNGGENWNIIIVDSNLSGILKDIVDVDFQSSTHGYVVINNSQSPVHHQSSVLFTKDGGATWTASQFGMCGVIGSNMIDTGNGYFFGATCFGGRTIDRIVNRNFVNTTYNTGYSVFLRGMDFYKPHYGITAGDQGFLYRTTNSGVSWDTISPPFFQTFNDIKFIND